MVTRIALLLLQERQEKFRSADFGMAKTQGGEQGGVKQDKYVDRGGRSRRLQKIIHESATRESIDASIAVDGGSTIVRIRSHFIQQR